MATRSDNGHTPSIRRSAADPAIPAGLGSAAAFGLVAMDIPGLAFLWVLSMGVLMGLLLVSYVQRRRRRLRCVQCLACRHLWMGRFKRRWLELECPHCGERHSRLRPDLDEEV